MWCAASPSCARASAAWRKSGETIGLVPTMGSLHEGHLSLVHDRRRKTTTGPSPRCSSTPPSSAPTRIWPHIRATKRPIVALLGEARADLLFAPGVSEMYPEGFATTVNVAGLTEHLCGPHRPGHFAGVATIVCQAAEPGAGRPRLFRREGFSAIAGRAPHGPRSRYRDRDRRRADDPRGGRPGDVVAQPLPLARRAQPGGNLAPAAAGSGKRPSAMAALPSPSSTRCAPA